MNVVNTYPDYFKINNDRIAFNKDGLFLSSQIIPDMTLLK